MLRLSSDQGDLGWLMGRLAESGQEIGSEVGTPVERGVLFEALANPHQAVTQCALHV